MAGLGILIVMVSLYFYDAAGDIVNPEDVIWGLGRFFRDIDRSDIKLLQRIGLTGAAVGGALLLGGFALIIKRDN